MQSEIFLIFFVFVTLLSVLVSSIFMFQFRKYAPTKKILNIVEDIFVVGWFGLIVVSVIFLVKIYF